MKRLVAFQCRGCSSPRRESEFLAELGLRDLGDQVDRKLLEVERVSQQCVLTQDALDRLQRPTVEAGQRTAALRFGDPRVMALFQAITAFTHLPRGFRNRDLRPQVEALLAVRTPPP